MTVSYRVPHASPCPLCSQNTLSSFTSQPGTGEPILKNAAAFFEWTTHLYTPTNTLHPRVLSLAIISIRSRADSLVHCHHERSPSPHALLLPPAAFSPYLSLLGASTLSPFPMPLPACSFPHTFTLSLAPFPGARRAACTAITLSTFITLHSFPQW